MNFSTKATYILCALFLLNSSYAQDDELYENDTIEENTEEISNAELQELIQQFTIIDSLSKLMNPDSTGTKTISDGKVTITIPQGFYFLDAKDSKILLEEMWGNPPSDDTEAMLVTKDGYFGDSVIAITMQYTNDGHIEDKDAEDINYDELLEEMQTSAEANNPQRIEMGYNPISIIGWASTPFYDQVSKKLHWAKEAKFGDAEENTLNYDLRILGREGSMDLTFIAGINQLDDVKNSINTIMGGSYFYKRKYLLGL